MNANAQSFSVERIALDLENPRHKTFEEEDDVIEYLCRKEQVLPLARDMAEIGLNPLELFALIPVDPKRVSPRRDPFVVAEGNRRMCAIKLLHDPDRAPADFRESFWKLRDSAKTSFAEVLGVVFKDKEEIEGWLGRIHAGPQNGIGRRSWNPEQKTRYFKDKKNALAQALLDHAEKHRMISTEERRGKLTTAQRYLGNPFFRESLGVEYVGVGQVTRTRPAEEFDKLLNIFVHDLIAGEKVHSRTDAEDIKTYGRNLGATPEISGRRIQAESLLSIGLKKGGKRLRPTEPEKPEHVLYDSELASLLKKLPNYKLEKLYFSICDISLEQHTPLIAVGIWAFLETLTALEGRNPGNPFLDYLAPNKIVALGVADKEGAKPISQAVRRASAYGNTTKHDARAATFDRETVANDMEIMTDLLKALVRAC